MGSLNEVQFMKNVDFLPLTYLWLRKTGGHQISTTSIYCTYPYLSDDILPTVKLIDMILLFPVVDNSNNLASELNKYDLQILKMDGKRKNKMENVIQ